MVNFLVEQCRGRCRLEGKCRRVNGKHTREGGVPIYDPAAAAAAAAAADAAAAAVISFATNSSYLFAN